MATGKLWIFWLFLDILTDFVYLSDMVFRSKTGTRVIAKKIK